LTCVFDFRDDRVGIIVPGVIKWIPIFAILDHMLDSFGLMAGLSLAVIMVVGSLLFFFA
jgi:hypothetical protein